MASILAYIEVREGAVTTQSRYAIAEARRVADSAGATVYGLVAVGPSSHVQIDALAESVSSAGADRVLCSSDPGLAGPPLDVTHAALLMQIAEHLRPVLILFPAGGAGAQLGPPLAVRIGAAYMPAAAIDIVPEPREHGTTSQRVIVRRWRAARDGLRTIDVGDLERPVVVSMIAGAALSPTSASYAEVEIIPCPESKYPGARLMGTRPDEWSEVETLKTLLWSTGDAQPEGLSHLRSVLPAGVGVLAGRDADAADILAATPSRMMVLSPDRGPSPASLDLPLVAPGALPERISAHDDGEAASPSRADKAIAALAAALSKHQSAGGHS